MFDSLAPPAATRPPRVSPRMPHFQPGMTNRWYMPARRMKHATTSLAASMSRRFKTGMRHKTPRPAYGEMKTKDAAEQASAPAC